MGKEEILNQYRKPEERLLIAKIMDKMKMIKVKNKITYSDFLDPYQQQLVETFLKQQKQENFLFYGGKEEAERKIVLFYSEKLQELFQNRKIDFNSYVKVIRIDLPNELKGQYAHKHYLGAFMKLGLKREKIGDILVEQKGADIFVLSEVLPFLLQNLSDLTRFQKAKISQIAIKDTKRIKENTQIIEIIVSSFRLDSIVSELAKIARSKASQKIETGQVFINFKEEVKVSKKVKIGDKITIRKKGRFVIKDKIRQTKQGKIILSVEKYQ